MYDIRWSGLNTNSRSEQDTEKRRREAAEASQQQAAKDVTNMQNAGMERQGHLKRWISESNRYQDEILQVNRRIKRLAADIARLRAIDDEEVKKEKEKNSWWAYLSSPIYGRVQETEEEKRNREVERLQRVASKSIKNNELANEEAKLQRWKDFLKRTNDKINAEYKKRDDEAREAAAKKQAEFQKQQEEARQAEQEKRRAEMRKRQQEVERVAKAQREKREREEKEAARAAEEAKLKWEKQCQEERTKMAEERRKEDLEDAKLARQGKNRLRNGHIVDIPGIRRTSCQHDKFWPKVDGGQVCSHCHRYQHKFVFRCPDCRMVACASCRQSLRGERQRSGRGRGRSNAGSSAKNFWEESYVNDHCDDYY